MTAVKTRREVVPAAKLRAGDVLTGAGGSFILRDVIPDETYGFVWLRSSAYLFRVLPTTRFVRVRKGLQ